jgi:hypothetical protein
MMTVVKKPKSEKDLEGKNILSCFGASILDKSNLGSMFSK